MYIITLYIYISFNEPFPTTYISSTIILNIRSDITQYYITSNCMIHTVHDICMEIEIYKYIYYYMLTIHLLFYYKCYVNKYTESMYL